MEQQRVSKGCTPLGVERAVTRWFVKYQTLLDEITRLEAILQQEQSGAQEQSNPPEKGMADVALQLQSARARLHTLGPCPKPMMG